MVVSIFTKAIENHFNLFMKIKPIVRNTINKITDQLHFSSNHGKLNMISKRYTNMNIGHEFLIIIINLQQND